MANSQFNLDVQGKFADEEFSFLSQGIYDRYPTNTQALNAPLDSKEFAVFKRGAKNKKFNKIARRHQIRALVFMPDEKVANRVTLIHDTHTHMPLLPSDQIQVFLYREQKEHASFAKLFPRNHSAFLKKCHATDPTGNKLAHKLKKISKTFPHLSLKRKNKKIWPHFIHAAERGDFDAAQAVINGFRREGNLIAMVEYKELALLLTAVDTLSEENKKCYAEDCYQLWQVYSQGKVKGIEAYQARALHWFSKAVELRHPLAELKVIQEKLLLIKKGSITGNEAVAIKVKALVNDISTDGITLTANEVILYALDINRLIDAVKDKANLFKLSLLAHCIGQLYLGHYAIMAKDINNFLEWQYKALKLGNPQALFDAAQLLEQIGEKFHATKMYIQLVHLQFSNAVKKLSKTSLAEYEQHLLLQLTQFEIGKDNPSVLLELANFYFWTNSRFNSKDSTYTLLPRKNMQDAFNYCRQALDLKVPGAEALWKLLENKFPKESLCWWNRYWCDHDIFPPADDAHLGATPAAPIADVKEGAHAPTVDTDREAALRSVLFDSVAHMSGGLVSVGAAQSIEQMDVKVLESSVVRETERDQSRWASLSAEEQKSKSSNPYTNLFAPVTRGGGMFQPPFPDFPAPIASGDDMLQSPLPDFPASMTSDGGMFQFPSDSTTDMKSQPPPPNSQVTRGGPPLTGIHAQIPRGGRPLPGLFAPRTRGGPSLPSLPPLPELPASMMIDGSSSPEAFNRSLDTFFRQLDQHLSAEHRSQTTAGVGSAAAAAKPPERSVVVAKK